MIVSYELLHELETVLLRNWFRRKLTVSDVLEYVLWLRERATLVEIPATLTVEEVSPDPDDDYLYALGLAEGEWCRLRGVGRRWKLYDRIISGRSDANIPFEQVRALLLHLLFEERVRGSHHVFTREDIQELINLQETEGGKCVPYQVKQVRSVLKKYNLRKEL